MPMELTVHLLDGSHVYVAIEDGPTVSAPVSSTPWRAKAGGQGARPEDWLQRTLKAGYFVVPTGAAYPATAIGSVEPRPWRDGQ